MGLIALAQRNPFARMESLLRGYNFSGFHGWLHTSTTEFCLKCFLQGVKPVRKSDHRHPSRERSAETCLVRGTVPGLALPRPAACTRTALRRTNDYRQLLSTHRRRETATTVQLPQRLLTSQLQRSSGSARRTTLKELSPTPGGREDIYCYADETHLSTTTQSRKRPTQATHAVDPNNRPTWRPTPTPSW